jgi:hypothetical protein
MLRARVSLLVLLSFEAACYQGAPMGADASTGDPATGTAPETSSDTTNDTTPPGTSGEDSTGPVCPANGEPAAPTVSEPAADRIDVVPATMTIVGSAFSDPDPGDMFGGVEAEIWRFKDGAATKRVWHAEKAGAAPPALTLADGVFDDGEEIKDWNDYAVRLRYRDEHGACSAYGPWSADLVFRTDDGSTALFDESVVRDFHLEIPPASVQALNAQAIPPGCQPYKRDYYSGTLRYEDQTFGGIGIKTKGGCGTSRSLDQKASFKVNLEWDDPAVAGCPGERRLFGQKSFTFNNGVQDRTATHERLGYALFRAMGIPAPRMAHVRLFVNGELWGLYQHVETIDRRFLSRWFASKEGMLYEGVYWCDLEPGNVPMNDDDDSGCLSREFSPDECSIPEPGADPEDYSLLRELTMQIEALPPDGFYAGIQQIFEFDRFLTTWAIESVIGHWDNYAFDIRNNYRVYHDPSTDRWTLISTGIDQTFVDDQDPWAVSGLVAARCLQEPDCEDAFAAKLAEVNGVFEGFMFEDRAQAIRAQIEPLVAADPRKEYDMTEFANKHAEMAAFFMNRPARIREYLTAHGY